MSDDKISYGSNSESNKSDLESMLEDLTSENPISEVLEYGENNVQKDEINIYDHKSKLKNQEIILTGIDDLLISGGARLILFLPLIVVILFGLAQSFSDSNPDWWVNSVQSLIFNQDISTSIYFISLLIMIADLSLLFILSLSCKVPKANPLIFEKFGGSVAILTVIQIKTHAMNIKIAI